MSSSETVSNMFMCGISIPNSRSVITMVFFFRDQSQRDVNKWASIIILFSSLGSCLLSSRSSHLFHDGNKEQITSPIVFTSSSCKLNQRQS